MQSGRGIEEDKTGSRDSNSGKKLISRMSRGGMALGEDIRTPYISIIYASNFRSSVTVFLGKGAQGDQEGGKDSYHFIGETGGVTIRDDRTFLDK